MPVLQNADLKGERKKLPHLENDKRAGKVVSCSSMMRSGSRWVFESGTRPTGRHRLAGLLPVRFVIDQGVVYLVMT